MSTTKTPLSNSADVASVSRPCFHPLPGHWQDNDKFWHGRTFSDESSRHIRPDPRQLCAATTSEESAMTQNISEYFYGIVLIVGGLMLGGMAIVEFRGIILPTANALWIVAGLAAIVVGDRLLQLCIKRGLAG